MDPSTCLINLLNGETHYDALANWLTGWNTLTQKYGSPQFPPVVEWAGGTLTIQLTKNWLCIKRFESIFTDRNGKKSHRYSDSIAYLIRQARKLDPVGQNS